MESRIPFPMGNTHPARASPNMYPQKATEKASEWVSRNSIPLMILDWHVRVASPARPYSALPVRKSHSALNVSESAHRHVPIQHVVYSKGNNSFTPNMSISSANPATETMDGMLMRVYDKLAVLSENFVSNSELIMLAEA